MPTEHISSKGQVAVASSHSPVSQSGQVACVSVQGIYTRFNVPLLERVTHVTLMSHMQLFLCAQVICLLIVLCESNMLQYPSFYCPIDGLDNNFCYSLRSETSNAAGVKRVCKLDSSASFGAVYLQKSHVESVSIFLQEFYDKDDNDTLTQYVWLGGMRMKDVVPEPGVSKITWEPGEYLPDSQKQIQLETDVIKSGLEKDYCIAQSILPSKSKILTWLPCSYELRVLCSKDISGISYDTIFDSIKYFMLKIKCKGYDPQVFLNKINTLKQQIDQGNLHGSYTFPVFNLCLILLVAGGYTYVQYEHDRFHHPQVTPQVTPSSPKSSKAEARVSIYEDLRSEYETYSHNSK